MLDSTKTLSLRTLMLMFTYNAWLGSEKGTQAMHIVVFGKLLLYFVLMFNLAGIRHQSFMEIA
jgi:hypothetical protein